MQNSVDLSFLKTIIQRHQREYSVDNVLSAQVAPASGAGDNYSSTVLRVKLEVLLASGRKVRKSVIIKRFPQNQEYTVKWLKRFGVFPREVEVMGVVLPGMESLMDEFGDTHEIVWPKLIHYTPYSEVVIEDLKVYGYEHGDRQNGFNFEQAELVLENTGRFHALSVILRDRCVLDPMGHTEHVLPHSPDMVKNYIQASFQTLSKIILRDWSLEWEDIGNRLAAAGHRVPAYMKEFGRIDDTRFNVLNHGDLWAPNVLFRYSRNKKYPISMRLIDYQMTFYTTYAFDLNHFLYSSISHDVRMSKFNDLLRIYHDSLKETFEFYQYDMQKVPSFADVLKEMENTSFFALIAVVMIMPVLMSKPEDAVDFEEVITPKDDIVDMNENIFSAPKYVSALKDCLSLFAKKGVF